MAKVLHHRKPRPDREDILVYEGNLPYRIPRDQLREDYPYTDAKMRREYRVFTDKAAYALIVAVLLVIGGIILSPMIAYFFK